MALYATVMAQCYADGAARHADDVTYFEMYFRHSTMGQNRKKNGINSHLIIHCPTSEGVSKVSERSGSRERSELCGESEQVSGASERMSGASEWPSTYVWVFV